MYSIKRMYNQNRRIIWTTIIIIAFVIIMIKLMNYIAKINLENNSLNDTNQSTNSEQIEKDTYSVVSEKNIPEETAKNNIDTIDNFFEFCNNKQTEEAYNLLSKECKEVLYPTLESFEKNYYNNIFISKKSYSRQAWITKENTTYQIRIIEDALATGKISTNNIIQDYFTIVKENGEEKLNISNYIGRKQINKQSERQNVKIDVVYVDIYMDYEEYIIEVTNNNVNAIMIDSLETLDSTYVLGDNDSKYTSYIHEVSKNSSTVNLKTSKNIKIKFNKIYDSNVETEKIVFEDMIINNQKNCTMEIDI